MVFSWLEAGENFRRGGGEGAHRGVSEWLIRSGQVTDRAPHCGLHRLLSDVQPIIHLDLLISLLNAISWIGRYEDVGGYLDTWIQEGIMGNVQLLEYAIPPAAPVPVSPTS